MFDFKHSIIYPLLIAASLVLVSGCEPFATQFEDVEPGDIYYAANMTAPPPSVQELKVMTWNIRFGAGRILWFGDSCGDRVILSQEEVYSSLERIAEFINTAQPDILLLQEVDINSKKSGYIDQVQWILDHTELNYGSFAFTWKSPFVPSDGLGRIYSGNAVLSRWPINEPVRIQLPRREDQDALTNYFYIQSCILKSRIDVPGLDNFYVYNVHLTAFATDDTKLRQINKLAEVLDNADGAGQFFIAGGDFNLLPPNSDSTDYCMEEKCDDESFHHPGDDPFHKEGANYTPEITWMNPIYSSYNPAVSLEKYGDSQSDFFTHTTTLNNPYDRKLDYLFTNFSWMDNSDVTYQQALDISDHAPVSALWEVP
jgi:endonuclease/exonuclease/phosphatase family metal-dependent hydrolase